jgi:hypothetical protein
VGVGLHLAGEPLEHLPDREAGVLGLEVEKDVILVGERDEEVSLSARSLSKASCASAISSRRSAFATNRRRLSR